MKIINLGLRLWVINISPFSMHNIILSPTTFSAKTMKFDLEKIVNIPKFTLVIFWTIFNRKWQFRRKIEILKVLGSEPRYDLSIFYRTLRISNEFQNILTSAEWFDRIIIATFLFCVIIKYCRSSNFQIDCDWNYRILKKIQNGYDILNT